MALITEAMVQQYKGNVIHLYQQGVSKLRGTVREEPLTGEAHFFERLAASEMTERVGRHVDTPIQDEDFTRRKVTLRDFEWARLVDQQDKIRLLVTPESEFAINAAKALNRNYDRTIIDALPADSYAGKTGTTAVTFATEKLFDTDKSAAALVEADIRAVKSSFDNLDIDEEGWFALMSPDGLLQLLGDSKVSSADYNTIKALAAGSLKDVPWMGFNWIVSTLAPSAGSTNRYCYFWHRDAMGIAIGKEPNVRMSERDDKSYAVQVYASRTMGATRIQPGVGRLKVKAGVS